MMDGVILLQVKSNQDFYIKKLIDRKESNMSTSIKVKVLNRNTLELSEDAKAGDFIELDKIESLDTGFITDLISKERETYVKKQINEELKKQAHSFELEKQKLLAEQENKLHKENQEKIDNFNKKIAELTSNNKIEIEKLNHEHEKREAELQTKITSLNNDRDKDLEIEKNKIEKNFDEKIKANEEKYNEELTKLKEIKTSLEEKIKNFEENKKLEIEKTIIDTKAKEKEELEEKHKKEIEEYKKIIDQLRRDKSALNSKNIGEDLEVWCDREINQYMQNGLSNCTWYKDNKVIKNEDESKGSKADFIFKIYADENHKPEELLTSVCLEMKDENPDSVNKKANKDYYSQLDKNRIKKDCKYAVLVSDLERDKPNDIPIYKVLDYQDMYVVRPEYMMTFLNMLVSLNTTFAKLTLIKSREDEKFKSLDEFSKEFDALKKTYLDSQLEKLEKDISALEKSNETIFSASKNISDTIFKIRNSYINQIQEKLNKFSVKVNREFNKTFKD